MQSFLNEAESNGAVVAYSHEFISGTHQDDRPLVHVRSPSGQVIKVHCQTLINSAGLGAHHLAKSFETNFQIKDRASHVPKLTYSKGNYFSLSGAKPFKKLIYPVPTPNTLGIHATLDLAGQCRFGPDHEETSELRYDVDPERVHAFYESIRRYYPNLKDNSLIQAYSGIRPQLYQRGEAPADFVVQTAQTHSMTNVIHLYGIESPGLTASLAIAEEVSQFLEEMP